MKVLIPVDGSEQALQTIRESGRFIDKQLAEVYLFTVNVPVSIDGPFGLCLPVDDSIIKTILDKAEAVARTTGLNPVSSSCCTYLDPAAAICDYATETQVDLILMGSHGYHGFEKFLMGSVSEQVFRQAKQPVILVRNEQPVFPVGRHSERPSR